jgi:hypothetical protein
METMTIEVIAWNASEVWTIEATSYTNHADGTLEVTWAVFILVVTVANLVLRLTYFRTVLPEIRQERKRHRS